jgi:hypothetical protein
MAINASIFGGGPADDLFIAMGGDPTGLRFQNGDNTPPYTTPGKGVMATLSQSVQFGKNQYGNHSSADYFAETWEFAVLGASGTDSRPKPDPLNWMNDYISGLN